MTDTTITTKDPTGAERARRYRARQKENQLAVCDSNSVVSQPAPTDAVVPHAARVTVLAPERHGVTASRLVAATVALLGAVLAGVGIYLNASFLFAFGRSNDAGVLLAVLGLVIDCLTLVMPSVAALLWARGRYGWSVTAGCVTVIAFVMTLLATTGFVATHIGDAIEARGINASGRAALVANIERLRADRDRLGPVATVTAASEAAAQSAVTAAATARNQECDRGVGVNCRKRVAEMIERKAELAGVLRDKALTDQAARIETELADSARALAGLPAIGAADPQAEGAAALVGWITAGRVVLTAHDVTMIRTAGLTLMPALAGLLLAFAIALCQPSRSSMVR